MLEGHLQKKKKKNYVLHKCNYMKINSKERMATL